jgi:hypothetical protein
MLEKLAVDLLLKKLMTGFYYRVHQSMQLNSILNHKHPVHILTHYLRKMYFNIIFPPKPYVFQVT